MSQKTPKIELSKVDKARLKGRVWEANPGITFMAPLFISASPIEPTFILLTSVLLVWDYWCGPVSVYKKYIPNFQKKYCMHALIALSGWLIFLLFSLIKLPQSYFWVSMSAYIVLLAISITVWV